MGERKGTKGLELWCRRMTEGYPGVNVVNMTTSWRDGLAFCAIIHHFRPDLIEFSKLNKDDIYYNNELAFRTAERHLGIPALLEPEDMVEYPVPDRLSILTYLSQFYQTFVVGQGKSPARIAPKRPATSPERGIVSSPSTSPPSKVASGKIRREPCAKCGHPVFIAERLNVGKLLYHRTCFRCARCNSQLTLANYYETENNEFCCETCPDEEKQPATGDSSSVLTRSLSDEEKSASLKLDTTDDYSEKFETALEQEQEEWKRELSSSRYSNARSFFITSQVGDSGTEDEPPDLPETKPPAVDTFSDSGFRLETENDVQIIISSVSDESVKSQDVVTKDTISAEGNTSSLVKARMRLFETIKSDVTNESVVVNKVPLKNSSSENRNVDSDLHSFRNNIVNDKVSVSAVENTEIEEEKTIEPEEQATKPVIKTVEPVIVEEQATKPTTDEEKSTEPPFTEDKPIEPPLNEEKFIELPTTEQQNLEPPIKEEKITDLPVEDSVITISSATTEESAKDSVITISDSGEEAKPVDNEETKESSLAISVTSPPRIVEEANSRKNEEYPEDLNPFGDDEEEEKKKTSVSLNPFEDDEDEPAPSPIPAARKKIIPSSDDKNLSGVYIKRISVNPFEEDEEKPAPQPRKKLITPPRISLNPFWSEDEEDKPVPKPRISKTSVQEAKPREFGDSSSTSSQSGSAVKKKKPAPKPPMIGGTESGPSSLTSSPCQSVTHSPRLTPKIRKNKKAPLPPASSTPLEGLTAPPEIDVVLGEEFEQEKSAKDEVNRNRQSQNLSLQSPSSSENSSSLGAPNKSTYGKWKRRKGQAPSRPIPQRRIIKSLPMIEVKRELEVIEIQQQGLEKQGVRLEQIIREKCEGPDVNPDDTLPPEIEEMVLQLFELVNEKNELFRRQAELMYLRRQHKLEEEHAEIEYQIRCLMLQPEANKTDSDKAKEEELINRLVEIVERRNEIIECLEMDRVREAEEDDSINNQLNLYSLKKEDKLLEKKSEKKEKKKHKKEKKFKLKTQKVDADKDIDESESSTSLVKDKKKKKFNIF